MKKPNNNPQMKVKEVNSMDKLMELKGKVIIDEMKVFSEEVVYIKLTTAEVYKEAVEEILKEAKVKEYDIELESLEYFEDLDKESSEKVLDLIILLSKQYWVIDYGYDTILLEAKDTRIGLKLDYVF
jgi:hypothetical protein